MAGIFRKSLNSSDDFEMRYNKSRNYDVRVQDLTPFAGSFIYMFRNQKKNNWASGPYNEFMKTGRSLFWLDMATGFAACAGMATYLIYL